MTNKEEINDLFSMFHDFEIKELTYCQNLLTLIINLPWGQILWDDYNFNIKIEISGCNYLSCIYGDLLKTPENLLNFPTHRKFINKETTEPETISALGLEIQSHICSEPNNYEFRCNASSQDCAGGELSFTADTVTIFDMAGNEISLTQMDNWCEEVWKKLSKG